MTQKVNQWWVSYKRQKLLDIRRCLCLPTDFGGVRVAHLLSFMRCVFCFVCLRLVSCAPNVASFSGLSILDCLFVFFSNAYSIYEHTLINGTL